MKKLKWNFWRIKFSPRLIHYSQMISLSLFTFSYFEEFCIWERKRNCVLSCPTRTGRVWWWRSDCCWSWSRSAWRGCWGSWHYQVSSSDWNISEQWTTLLVAGFLIFWFPIRLFERYIFVSAGNVSSMENYIF